MICAACGREDQRKQKCTLYGEECNGETTTEDSTEVRTGPAGPSGSAGKAGTDGVDGQDGISGTDGADGQNGADGNGCTVSPALNGALITCATGSVLVLNGEDGTDGSDAPPTPYSVTELIDPCGHQSSWDEVLLRLANNDIIASFSENVNGKNTRFVRLVPGMYQTTDSTSCIFTVHNDMSITW